MEPSRDKAPTNEEDLRARVAQLEHAQELLARSEEAERQFIARLEDLCRRAVELGRDRLGFDRLGIWFRTEDPEVITGSFGVDTQGNVCDERHLRTRVSPMDPDGRVLLSKESIVLVGEGPLLDARGEEVGHASQIFAALWDGNNVIGHVSADNRLHGTPLEQHQCELLRLFGTTLGYLCTRKRVEKERSDLIDQLQDAVAKIKTLRGLLPICANCKKIRDDQGYWSQIEDYVRDHSDADFSHSLCPDCMRKLYPDLARE